MGVPGQRLYRLEVAFAVIAGALCVVTVALPNWIEVLFRVDPDHHDGVVEWLVAGALVLISIAASVSGRQHRRQWLAQAR